MNKSYVYHKLGERNIATNITLAIGILTAQRQHVLTTRHSLMRQNHLGQLIQITNPVAVTVAMANMETSVLFNSGNSVCLFKTAVA